MKLPNGKKAIVPKEKLLDYILSERHLIGKSKAKFFRKLGFNENNIKLLEENLLSIVSSEEVKSVFSSQYGDKYVIDGQIKGLKGKNAQVRTIWIIEIGQTNPRFVTVYPV